MKSVRPLPFTKLFHKKSFFFTNEVFPKWQKRGCGGGEWEGGGRSCSFSRFHNTLILVSLFIVWSSWIVSNGYISNKGWISDYSCAEEFQLCFLFGFLLSLYLTKICLPSSAKIGQRHKVGKSWFVPTVHLLQGLASTNAKVIVWWMDLVWGIFFGAPPPRSSWVGLYSIKSSCRRYFTAVFLHHPWIRVRAMVAPSQWQLCVFPEGLLAARLGA